jgi:Fe-S cluster assembly scaffold protein SufB
MELSSYFRINAAGTGQFERTLIVADEGSFVSYMEGCTAPMRDENQLHAAVVEIIVEKDAEVKYSTVQNWYPGDAQGKGGIFNRAVGMVLGAFVFRLVYTIALRMNMPAYMLKLVSSTIVVIAIFLPYLKKQMPLMRRAMAGKGKGGN